MSDLTWNRYGKSRIRLVKVRRSRDPHELVDLTIDVQLEGAFGRRRSRISSISPADLPLAQTMKM